MMLDKLIYFKYNNKLYLFQHLQPYSYSIFYVSKVLNLVSFSGGWAFVRF